MGMVTIEKTGTTGRATQSGTEDYFAALGDLSYLSEDGQVFIRRALEFAFNAHSGQRRRSGGPYIEHPVATAAYLGKLHLDKVSIASALLHDVLEDCEVAAEELETEFGTEVRNIVEGVTKMARLESIRPKGELSGNTVGPEPAAKNVIALRKVLIATASDVRVILIKLADRLHNVSTLRHLKPEKRKRIAEETLKIYAPLAHRLGISDLKWRLEDESFKHAHAREYKIISRFVNRKRMEREEYAQELTSKLRDAMKNENISCEVHGRPKHLYSIYGKWKTYMKQGRAFDDIHDLIALRAITDSKADCYRVLGVVHEIWPPVHGAFDDYIARPKENNYQSLHTAVMGQDNHPFEVQIRTREMHKISEEGVAAHWIYKDGGGKFGQHEKNFEKRIEWLQNILKGLRDLQGEESGDSDYVSSVETDVLGSRVFVYTPKGDLIDLPAGATGLDFAYSVHTQLGHSCVGAVVNGRIVSISSKLSNGDTVAIRRSSKSYPKLDWLNPHLGYINSASARNKIRAWFKSREKSERVKRGLEIWERELHRFNFVVGTDEGKESIANFFGFPTHEHLLDAVGSSRLNLNRFCDGLVAKLDESATEREAKTTVKNSSKPAPTVPGVVVTGRKNVSIRIPKCCSPAYGDEIMGYFAKIGRVTVHKTGCIQVKSIKDVDRIVRVSWGHLPKTRPTRLEIIGQDRIGMIRDITHVLSSEHVNIRNISSSEREGNESKFLLTLYTLNGGQVGKLIARISDLHGVHVIRRITDKKEDSNAK